MFYELHGMIARVYVESGAPTAQGSVDGVIYGGCRRVLNLLPQPHGRPFRARSHCLSVHALRAQPNLWVAAHLWEAPYESPPAHAFGDLTPAIAGFEDGLRPRPKIR